MVQLGFALPALIALFFTWKRAKKHQNSKRLLIIMTVIYGLALFGGIVGGEIFSLFIGYLLAIAALVVGWIINRSVRSSVA